MIEAKLGEPLTLNCSVRGSRLEGVKWYRDATLIQDVPRRSSALSQLQIPSTRIEDLGIYQCFAYNHRESVSGRIQVVLTGTSALNRSYSRLCCQIYTN